MSNLTDENIRSVFDLFDADGSGFVDAEEMGLAMKALGFGELPKEEVDALITETLPEGTTHIEFPEFKRIVVGRMAARDSPEEIGKAFQMFDREGKGKLTVEDFIAVAKDLGEITDEASERMHRELYTDLIAEANSAFVVEDAAEGGIVVSQWRKMMREALADKRHRIDESAYSISTRAKVAKKGPYGIRVEAGKTYYWCACGLSKNQPFCDGSHVQFNRDHGSSFQPLKYVADQSRTVWFCGCKQTKAPPFCDGTHTSV